MDTYDINGKKYYSINEIMLHHRKIFKGCKNGREFVIRNNVPDNKYIFAKNSEDKLIVTDGTSKKFDKIYILKKWFDNEYINGKKEEIVEVIEDAPEIIDLEDNEKFIDNDGNIVEIEVRGERDYEKCYFKVKDVMDGFDIKYLNDVIINKNRNGYIINNHYTYFYSPVSIKDRQRKIKILYLTYLGMLRVLFASHKGTADKFICWATKTLFTAQMGTITQKNKLVGNLLGVSSKAVKEVFNKTARSIPCVYLFSIGSVKDLRKSLNLDDKYQNEDYVYKWGMSDDLERRTKQHEKTYGKFKGSNIELVLFGMIDQQYISKAETRVKHLFEGLEMVVNHETFVELAIIPKKKMKLIREQYDLISSKYMGHITELVNQIKEKDNEIALMKKDMELMKGKHENDLMRKDMEIMKKDMEIMKLRKNK